MNISVIIPSYNSERTIAKCLTNILNQKIEVLREVIVVDSSPGDGVDKLLKKYPSVRVLKQKEKTFAGKARNLGAAASHGELLLFVDSDIVLGEGALSRAWSFYKKGISVFGGSIELANEAKTIASLTELFLFFHEQHRGRRFGARRNLPSAILGISREIFKKSGGFKDLSRAQDTEFTERLVRMGCIIHFIPEVFGFRTDKASFCAILRKNFYGGRGLFFARYSQKPLFYKVLLFLILPIFCILKHARIIFRNCLRPSWQERVLGLLLGPSIFFFGVAWMLGMYTAFFHKDPE